MLERLREPGAAPYLVAEAGVNHEGDLERALEMVRRAATMGVQAVKFQTYKADRLAVRHSPAYWDTSEEQTPTQFELFSKYDRFGEAEYRRLAEECRAVGVDFLTSPFDVEATEWLEEIGQAVALLREAGATEIALLHCTLAYPTDDHAANVAAVAELARSFPDCVPGYSDHTRPSSSFGAIAAAYALGARVVEKHYTLDKSLPGNDHYHAFDPDDFTRLAAELDRLRALLGAGVKDVLPAEEPARVGARRSVVARVRIAAGTRLTQDVLDVKRPGTGIPPAFLDEAEAWAAACDIEEDSVLEWEMLTRA